MAIHETAVVEKTAHVGRNVTVGAGAHVYNKARCLDRCIIGIKVLLLDRVTIDRDAMILSSSTIAHDAAISDAAIIKNGAEIRNNVFVFGDALVDNARIEGSACIGYGAEIKNNRHYLCIGPLGSENRTVTLYRTVGGDSHVIAGCWNRDRGGTIDELEHRIQEGGGNGWTDYQAKLYRLDYEAFIHIARIRAAEWLAEVQSP